MDFSKITAYLDDMEIRTETVNPKTARSWKPAFSGNGIGTVSIYINDELYMEYIVDFEEGIHEVDTDFSAMFGGTEETDETVTIE